MPREHAGGLLVLLHALVRPARRPAIHRLQAVPAPVCRPLEEDLCARACALLVRAEARHASAPRAHRRAHAPSLEPVRPALAVKSSFFIDFDTETAYEFACLFLAIMVQHGVGGLLCVPALVPALGVPAHVATALACHGALCEAGWELQDILSRLFQVCCTKEGARNNPTALLVILGIHHTMGLSMARAAPRRAMRARAPRRRRRRAPACARARRARARRPSAPPGPRPAWGARACRVRRR